MQFGKNLIGSFGRRPERSNFSDRNFMGIPEEEIIRVTRRIYRDFGSPFDENRCGEAIWWEFEQYTTRN